MRKFLLLLTALFVTYSFFAQVPPNDLIENAIEIDPSNFVDENLRLDLATDSGISPVDCGTAGLAAIYYKFTATANVNVSARLTDMINTPITQSFVIIYNAPDLNQVDESQLTIASDCAFGTTGSAGVIAGQSYYIQVYRNDVNAFSRIAVVQGPTNDTIATAKEMTTSNYNDDNIRIDLARPNPGGQNGCAVTGFNTVYYKFTANTTGTASFFLFNVGPAIVGDSFVIVYTAANLNATSDTELTVASNCVFDTQFQFDIVDGQSYYVLVHRPDVDRLSRFSATLPQTVPASERQALIDFYNATDGPNWQINTNWNTPEPVSTWAGITVENGHVVEMGLGNVGVTGTIPNAIFNLPFLRSFIFQNNLLTGVIPDLTTITTLETFDIVGNAFTFEHLEPNFAANSTLANFRYETQRRINEFTLIDDPVIGQEYTFSTTVNGTGLSYQWIKDEGGFLLETEDIPGATNSDYVIPSLQLDDVFSYSCRVTSSAVPGMTLLRNVIKLRLPVSQSERDALIAIYNATDGDNWANNENWLSSLHVDEWDGVQTVGDKVIVLELNFQNLNGQMPDEVGDLIHLKEIRISVNPNLTGPLPESIGNLTDLEFLRFQNNAMTGEIPSTISNLTNLTRVYLQFNQFTGNIPTGLGNSPNIIQIFLNDNQLDGSLPSDIGSLSNLISFDVSNNSLSGSLPTELTNLNAILLFDIANNDFSGDLPDWSGITDPLNASFDLTNNYFDFSNLLPLVTNGVEYFNLDYSPQRTLDQEQEIMSPPGIDIELNVNDTGIDRDANDTATSNEYQWFKDGSPISGANASIYTIVNAQVSDSGVYYCEITNPALPDLTIVRADITVVVDNNLSVSDFDNDGFRLYPNPAKDWITIQTKSLQNTEVELYNLNGQLLLKQSINSEITSLDINNLSSGVYIISLTNDNLKATKRFIKQ